MVPVPAFAGPAQAELEEGASYQLFAGAAPPPKPRAYLRSAIYGGVIGALLSALPFGFAFGLPLSGYLAVVFYKRRVAHAHFSRRQGFRLGALAGLSAFMTFLMFLALQVFAFRGGSELKQGLIDRIHQAQALNPDPQAQDVFQYFLTPHGMVVMTITGLLFLCVFFTILAGLGGAVCAALSRRSGPQG